MSSSPKIGAYVLETLTTGMYTNPLDTLREFVQNSADSIRKAEEIGLIRKGEGRIEIVLDPKRRTLLIRDNGIGVSKEDISVKLLNIGMSDKDFEKDAGFRGIGRLAAIAYCETLRFNTSFNNQDSLSQIEMNCLNLRRSMLPSMRQTDELANVLEKNSKVYSEKISKEDHFFEVVMDGISSEYALQFLDNQVLEQYLCQVAPVEMDAQRFFYKAKILEWQKHIGISTPTVTLVIKTPSSELQVFKPYKTHYNYKFNSKAEDEDQAKPVKFDVKGIGFYPENPSGEIPFWLWYGITDAVGMVDDERTRGFRFKKNNIAIGGPDRVTELFSEISKSHARLNAWYVGEIHILSPKAIPNARRDGFEDNETWLSIKEQITPFIRSMCSSAYERSKNANISIPKVKQTAEKVIEEASSRINAGFISKDERAKTLEQVKKIEEKVQKAFDAHQKKETTDVKKLTPVIESLQKIQDKIESENNYVIIKSNLDRKQRKLLKEVFQILYEALDDVNFKKAKSAILKNFAIEERRFDE